MNTNTACKILPKDLEAVKQTVKSQDRNRYISALFAPKEKQCDLFALYAFNVELARIGETVSEPLLGEIKLQWWREAVEKIEQGEVTGNPIADVFGQTYFTAALNKHIIQELIDARTFDISGDLMPDGQALKTYLTKTAGNVFLLAAQILSGKGHETLKEVAGAAGFSFGLTGILRSLPIHSARNQLYLPATQLSEYGVDQSQLFQGQVSNALHAMLAALRAEARTALAETQQLIPSIPQSARPAFLPLALVEPYLKALESPAHRPLHQIADINPVVRLWRMWRWA